MSLFKISSLTHSQSSHIYISEVGKFQWNSLPKDVLLSLGMKLQVLPLSVLVTLSPISMALSSDLCTAFSQSNSVTWNSSSSLELQKVINNKSWTLVPWPQPFSDPTQGQNFSTVLQQPDLDPSQSQPTTFWGVKFYMNSHRRLLELDKWEN